MDTQPLNEGSVSQLPEEVSKVLFSFESFDFMEEVLVDAGVVDPDVSVLSSELFFLARQERDENTFLQAVMKAYNLTQLQAQDVSYKVIEHCLLPLEEKLAFPLKDMIQAWQPNVTSESVNTPQTTSPVDALAPQVAVEPTVAPTTPTVVEPDFSNEEQEVEQLKKEIAHVIDKQGPLDVAGIVSEICQNPAFAFEDQVLLTRCQKAVESRVRDVRDAVSTKAMFEKSVEQGGVGVTGRRLADMVEHLEALVAVHHAQLDLAQAQDRETAKAQKPDAQVHQKKEEDLLSKRYVELTGRMPAERIAPASPPVTRTSAAISAHHEQLQREGKIDTEKVKRVVQTSTQSPAPKRPGARPSMQEVAFQKRLIGPVDEIGTLTLADFRRLSPQADQVVSKIKDKVDLIEEQGYDKKVAAIQAWRQSPLNQMYVELTRQSVLTGVPIFERLAQLRQKGEDVFTDEEVKAVMKINADMRF